MSLDRRTIVQAALDLLEESGIDGVSTRKLAERLGVKGPSLYWHFRNKDELLSYMSAAMFAEAVPEPKSEDPDFNWLDWVAAGARGIRRVALSRRDGAIVMAKSRPAPAARQPTFETFDKANQRSGLSDQDASHTLLALGRFALGWVLYEQTAAPRQTEAGGDEGFETGLKIFLDGLAERKRRAAA